MTPIPAAERIELLDILRGAALFGIIAANMRAFNSPMATYMDHSLMWTGTADRIAQGLVDWLISGKFITLFSFLFGIGFAVQMDRAEARGVAPRSFYLRRLGVLFGMGIAHMFLLWWGDILAAYAFVGFFLFLFRRRSQRTLLIWAGALYVWPMLVVGVMMILHAAGVHLPMPPKTTPAELQRIVAVYASGTYAEILRQHLKEAAFNGFAVFFYYPRLLGIFLLGLWTWRAGIIQNLGAYESRLKQWRNWGLATGLIGNGATVAIAEIFHPDPASFSGMGYIWMVVGSAAVPVLSLFYASTLALLCRDPRWRPRLAPFAAVGRTALSNYLLQTAICTTLYNSWGFGLYGSVGPLLGLAPTVAIYGAQVAGSAWWVRRFAFGPLEWVWRGLTYGRMQPMARPAAAGG